ncbi:IgGFc-binding protein [Nannocystis sp. SCPEA4]|uniref:IgGFc-binding protein n=1 Tax=Nannocystis sp. SCPEA4 TaxID=2996787 RepID=UPI002271052F|nr:IgGFc-binding protein [Nannocystis sp. SCPEA4]MCY1056951.1 IgGFc-binding protein [Nannocystis sp. SCPEA4]
MVRSLSCAVLALSLAACGDSSGQMTTVANPTSATAPETSASTGDTSSTTSEDPTTQGAPTTSTTTTDPTATDVTTAPPGPCPAGDIVCDGDVAQVCDGMGGYSDETQCAGECAPGLGCVDCIPGTKKCEGQNVFTCNEEGNGYDEGFCDPLLGLSCDDQGGGCVGACAQLGSLSYIGCEYYPTVTQQYDIFDLNNPFAVAVSNAADATAMVTITRGDELIAQVTVPAEDVKVVTLPFVNELIQGSGPTKHAKKGAYRLRSTKPVTVYQFMPLNAAQSNDASLLLPVNTWTGNYLVASWQYWNDYLLPGFYSVVASQDNTIVKLTSPPGGTNTQAGGGVDNTGNGMALLNTGDVLTVVAASGGDLTGSFVRADKPVQVIGGHECTQIPIGVEACDHLEEALFPIETLSGEYFVGPPVQTPNNALEKAMFVRIVAAEDDTNLVYTPDQAAAKSLAKAGEFIEIASTVNRFKVDADKRVLVVQYMVGQGAGYGTSDPAMVQAVPILQYREDYIVYANKLWVENFADIIAPDGATVTIDGAMVAGFKPIGGGYSLAHVELADTPTGGHTMSSNIKFGVTTYGVMDYGSYWYPGGLDLALLPPR